MVVNTCGFIDNAKEESVQTILNFAKKKEASFFFLSKVENRLHRFFLSVIDKPTGVDHHNITLFFMDD